MATQILALVAITLGSGADAVTHPAGWIGPVDDAVADDLLKLDPPAAQIDSSPLPAAAPKRSRSSRTAAPAADPVAGAGEGGGDGAGGAVAPADGSPTGGEGGGEG